MSGDVTSSSIYASASANSYTYNLIYKSVNGTQLGSSSFSQTYGTKCTITAPPFSGYITPASQQVTWDSTSAKTITFVYSVEPVGNRTVSGTCIASKPEITFSAEIQWQNRTADSVQVRFVWTNTICATGRDGYSLRLNTSCNGVSGGTAVITSTSTWNSSVSYARSQTVTTDWITVPVSATTQYVTTNIYWYQANANGNQVSGTTDYSDWWQLTIPTY